MARKKKSNSTKPIESLRHKDKRVNIPTEELRDFVKDDELRAKTILYPRDHPLIPSSYGKERMSKIKRIFLLLPFLSIYRRKSIPRPLLKIFEGKGKKRLTALLPGMPTRRSFMISLMKTKNEFASQALSRWRACLLIGSYPLMKISLYQRKRGESRQAAGSLKP